MDINKIVELLESVKTSGYILKVGTGEAIDSAIEAIKSKIRVEKELEKAIEKERTTLDQFTDDFNHHLWIMRGLQVAKKIMEGESYEDFLSHG